METNLKINYLSLSDIYDLQNRTGVQILYDSYIDEEALSEAIRTLIRRK